VTTRVALAVAIIALAVLLGVSLHPLWLLVLLALVLLLV
jgi:hypothetical protein